MSLTYLLIFSWTIERCVSIIFQYIDHIRKNKYNWAKMEKYVKTEEGLVRSYQFLYRNKILSVKRLILLSFDTPVSILYALLVASC